MVNATTGYSDRVRAAAATLGLDIEVRFLQASTHTAADAAAALGCDLAQVVKSLVFRGRDSGRPHLLLVSGANRVNESGIAAEIGEPLARPDAGYVREVTGYPIGGVPPFGHIHRLPTWFDRDLLRWNRVWAAAGTAGSMFEIGPKELCAATGARIVTVT